MKLDLKRCAAVGLAIGVLCFGGIGAAYAASDTGNAAPASNIEIQNHRGMERPTKAFGMDWSSFVENGTISQETADKIAAYMEAKAPEAKPEAGAAERDLPARFDKDMSVQRTDIFAEMVEAGVLTQAEADAMKAAIPTRQEGGGMPGKRGMDFSTLVTNGVISQETADKIAAYMEAKAPAAKPEIDPAATELPVRFDKDMSVQRTDIFAEMVDAGVLTQAEADAIKAAMPARPEISNNDRPGGKMGR